MYYKEVTQLKITPKYRSTKLIVIESAAAPFVPVFLSNIACKFDRWTFSQFLSLPGAGTVALILKIKTFNT